MDNSATYHQANDYAAPVSKLTLFEKIWQKHIVKIIEDGPSVLYIEKHLIHEITSPKTFEGLDKKGKKIL